MGKHRQGRRWIWEVSVLALGEHKHRQAEAAAVHSEGHTAHRLPAAAPVAPEQLHTMATTRFLPVQSGWKGSRDTGQQRGAPAAWQRSCSWKGRVRPTRASSPCGGESQCTQWISAYREHFLLSLHPEWVQTSNRETHTLNSEPVDTERTLCVDHQ